MADYVAFHIDEHPWHEVARGGVMERTGGKARRKILSEAETGLSVNMGEYDPNIVVDAHSHDQPELMYILDGEVTVGGRQCRAGTVLRIPANTVYGPLESGPNGVVMRPGPTNTSIAQ
jgi:quercetin dioxygenase-like cupin family protein